MGSKPYRRRRVLQFVGAGTLVGVAGCTGALQDGDSGATPTSATTGSTDETTTETTDEETTTDTTASMSTVFHLTSGTEEAQKHALGNVANLLADESTETDDVALVANSQGITAFINSTPLKAEARGLMEKDVSIRICENSMDAFDLGRSDFIEGIETVPAGVGELTKLQARDGYAYIRVP